MRILVVEDEENLNDIIVKKLKIEKYAVDSCLDGNIAMDYINSAEYDAIVLDIMISGISGLEVLRRMRSKNDKTPVILLTARTSIEDRVLGLDYGADDYLTKPFAFDELLARIRVVTRRAANNSSNIFKLADLVIDCDKRTAFRGNIEISLSSKEFSILEYMIKNKEIVLSREKICAHIWNYDYEGESNIVDVYIRYLRKKIDEKFEPKLIHTIRGAGYVLKK